MYVRNIINTVAKVIDKRFEVQCIRKLLCCGKKDG